LSVKNDLQKQITEFFTQVAVAARFDGVHDFIAFLEQIGYERLVRLLAVPRTAAA